MIGTMSERFAGRLSIVGIGALLLLVTLGAPCRAEPTPGFTDKAVVLSRSQQARYVALYKDPYVREVRGLLDRYLKGKSREGDMSAVDGLNGDKTDGLKAFSSDYYRSRFVVVEVAPALFGGHVVSIVFLDKPDRMFDVWIYKIVGGAYEPRAFSVAQNWSAEQIALVYENFLRDRKHSL